MPALFAVILAASHIVLVADQVPKLDTAPSCRAASAANANRNAEICKRDEDAAHGTLEQNWGQFTPAQRIHCVALSTVGGSPSYVELLTCLEIAKAAASLPESGKMPARGTR
jgi:hypothetical protein